MIGSRYQRLDVQVRLGIAIALMCALLVRVSVASPLRVASSVTTLKSDHSPVKPRLLDPRAFDWSIHTQVFSLLDSPEPVPLITHAPDEIQICRQLGPDSNRAPPQN